MLVSRVWRWWVVGWVLAAGAAAQATLPAHSGSAVEWSLGGVSFVSADRANVLQLGALVQGDGRFALAVPASAPPPGWTQAFLFRRVRPILQGRFDRRFEFSFVPDFAPGQMAVNAASISVRIFPHLALIIGKAHAPVRLKYTAPSASLRFPERSLVSDLEPASDVGVQVEGSAAAGGLSYEAGVFNGANDGTSGGFAHFGAHQLDARITAEPFLHDRREWWRDLGFALGGTRGTASGSLPVFKSFSQAKFFSYARGASADGTRWRLTPAVFLYHRAFAAFADYARSGQAVRGPSGFAAVNDLQHQAWAATALVVVTGESEGARGVVPRYAFDPVRGHWGALELALRHGQLSLDPRVSALGLAAPGASRTASASGVAADWYLSLDLKAVLAFERTVFDGGPQGPRPPEHALIYGLQISLTPSLPALR
ncbi:MAG TPA: hypothetical protein VIC54_02360 [Terriglobales bacterium]|jgi:phosphate-selective porin OprO/OprP